MVFNVRRNWIYWQVSSIDYVTRRIFIEERKWKLVIFRISTPTPLGTFRKPGLLSLPPPPHRYHAYEF